MHYFNLNHYCQLYIALQDLRSRALVICLEITIFSTSLNLEHYEIRTENITKFEDYEIRVFTSCGYSTSRALVSVWKTATVFYSVLTIKF